MKRARKAKVAAVSRAQLKLPAVLDKRFKSKTWTNEQIEELKGVYGSDPTAPLNGSVIGFAAKHGKNPANVARKARSLGLPVNQKRRRVLKRKPTRISGSAEELRALQSAAAKARIAKHGHPRGMLGKKHTQAAREAFSQGVRARWADPTSKFNSDEARQARSDRMLERIKAGAMRSGYTRGRGGRRPDLGDQYFRSSWEANYARYLKLLKSQGRISDWQYECKTFVFEAIKRGTRAYTPDFLVKLKSGAHEWHEVKGWMDQPSRTRLKRMAKYYPNEVIRVIDAKWFKRANASGLAAAIVGWERGGKRQRLEAAS